MKKTLHTCLFLISILSTFTKVAAQQNDVEPPRIAIFAPLYLDSAFGEKGYKYGKVVPPFAIPGVEYLYGAKSAIDSLQKEQVKANVRIFDSKSKINTIPQLISNNDLVGFDLIIGSVNGMDVKSLAEFANQKKIPFVSATFPNDAGVTNNPYFVVVNSTLKTNCEEIHRFVKAKLSEQRIVILTKEGKQEERIVNYFKEIEKNATGGSLTITYANLGADFSEESFMKHVDSTVLSTYIVATTDVGFAKSFADVLVKNKLDEQSNLIGLPTWDDATAFDKKEYKNLHLYYSVPINRPSHPFAIKMANTFKSKYGSSAGDNVYRGFETVYKYIKLHLKHGKNLSANFNDKAFSTLMNLDIQPVMLQADNMTLDYFENKKVYMIGKLAGITKTINF
jgi:hypothetical protein